MYHHRWIGFAGDMLSCQLLRFTDGLAVFIAAADFRIAAEIQLWLTWVSVATAIPLITVDMHLMLTQFNQRRLHVSRVAGLHS